MKKENQALLQELMAPYILLLNSYRPSNHNFRPLDLDADGYHVVEVWTVLNDCRMGHVERKKWDEEEYVRQNAQFEQRFENKLRSFSISVQDNHLIFSFPRAVEDDPDSPSTRFTYNYDPRNDYILDEIPIPEDDWIEDWNEQEHLRTIIIKYNYQLFLNK